MYENRINMTREEEREHAAYDYTMSKAEKFIQENTRNCSNKIIWNVESLTHDYVPWLTPDQTRRAVEITKEELIDKACEWLESVNLDWYQIREGVFSSELVKDFRKAMEK